MKHYLLPVLLTLILFVSCTKNNSSDSDNALKGICRMTSQVAYLTNDTVTVTYEYSSDGKLISTTNHNNPDEGTTYFAYSGSQCVFSTSSSNQDTTFYYYNSSGLLIRKVTIMPSTLGKHQFLHDFLYNGNSTHIVAEVITIYTDTIVAKGDSITYQYTDGNVTRIIDYVWQGNGWNSVQVDLTYDDKKNYVRSAGEPADSYVYWSTNNIATYTYAGKPYYKFDFLEYNQEGYPTSLKYTIFYLDTLSITENYKINYNCF